MKKLTDTSLDKLLRCFVIIFLGIGLYVFFVALFNKSLADYDLWGYLSFGRVLWQEGFFPYKDVFAYTPTKPLWVYHEWLTGVVFFGLVKFLGPASLQLLRYILALLTLCLIYETARKRGGNAFDVLVVLAPSILLIAFGYEPVRAQVFTFFFFTLTLYILECSKKAGNEKVLRWLPLIQIAWCNFHGGFVAGLGLIFLYALGEILTRRKIAVAYLKWGMIALSATLINPYGIHYWSYTLHAVSMPRPEITEWMSVLAALKAGRYVFPAVLFLIMSLIILLFMLMSRKKDVTDIFVTVAVIYLGTTHIRHSVLFGLVLGAYLPFYLSEYVWEARGKSKMLFGWSRFLPVFLLALLLAAYFHFYPVRPISFIPNIHLAVTADAYPTKAMAWMDARDIRGNILPHFEWGEYLMWSFYPGCRVAMDGRYETVYREDVHKEYFDFLYGRKNWDVFLKKYSHDVVLLKTGTKTHELMMRQKDWRLVYRDGTGVIFMKRNIAGQ